MTDILEFVDVDYIIGLLVFIFLSQFTIAPVIVRLTIKQLAEPELIPIRKDEIPSKARRFIETTEQQLMTVGLSQMKMYLVPNLVQKFSCVAAVFYKNPAMEMLGAFTIFQERQGRQHLMTSYHEIYFKISDNKNVLVNNSPKMQPWPGSKNRILLEFPGIKNAAQLYSLQTRLMVRAPGLAGKIKVPMNDDVNYQLSQTIKADVQYKAKQGLYYLDTDANVYRPTWKGAFLMTFGLTFPIIFIRKLFRRLRARRIMKSVGI